MRTLDLDEAAAWLKIHPNRLQERAKAGEIPGAKIGRRWVFIEEDLALYVRSRYREDPCSTEGETRGISSSSTAEAQLDALLGQTTNSKPSASTTSLKLISGKPRPNR
jgi:helix-turn-helix protein